MGIGSYPDIILDRDLLVMTDTLAISIGYRQAV